MADATPAPAAPAPAPAPAPAVPLEDPKVLLAAAVVRLRRDIAGASVAERIEAYLAASK